MLGDCYAFGQDNAQSIGLENLIWEQRSIKITKILKELQSHVYLLQEIDHYKDFYQPFFTKSFGYHTLYVKRPVSLFCIIMFINTFLSIYPFSFYMIEYLLVE